MKKKIQAACAVGALFTAILAGTLTACGEESFEILTPADHAENVTTCPEISWTQAANATSYHVEIASDKEYESVVREGVTSELSYTVGNALSHATQYYLRVTAVREEADKTVALCSQSVTFTTAEAHSTDAPDYTAARTLYDFESFENSEALREEFPRHVDGNEIGVNLIESGVNGSKAMEIVYAAGDRGWAGVLCKLPSDKKVWSGAKGIRMHVQGDGNGLNVEVRIGKRGYQSWAATFSVNNPEPCYVSIPFSAFDDIGGGDGIWDLAGITRFWLFFTGGSNSKIVIDDISIGSDENYTTDTRGEIGTSLNAPAGVFDNFDGYADDEAMGKKWTFEYMSENALADSPYSAGKALRLVPSGGWATARLNLPNYDFTEMGSIRFKASAGTYVVQLETSVGGVFEKENVLVSVDGDEAGVNVADLVPRAGTEGGVKLIRQLVIGFIGKSGATVYIDDVTFSDEEFVPPDHTAGMIENFEEMTADNISTFANVNGGTLALETENPLSGSKSAKFSADGVFDFEVNSAYFTKYNFENTIGFSFAVRLRSSAGNPSLIIQIGSWLNVYTITRPVYSSAQNNIEKIVVMYDAMTLADGSSGALNKAKINYLRVFVTQYDTDFTATIDDLQFFTAENYTPDTVVIDDFSSYADDTALSAAWHPNGCAVALENGAMKVTTESGWNGLQYNFAAAGGLGSADDYQNCYAISFVVTATVDVNLIVKLQRWANAKETTVAVKGGQTTHVVIYFNELTGENDWSDMIFNSLTLGCTYYGVTDIAIDNIAFLRG